MPHEHASSVHAPRVLGAKSLLGSRLYGWTGSSSDAVAHRIFAAFRLRAHSIIRLWHVLNVQLIAKETLPERVSVSRRENHSITNVESGKSEQSRIPVFPLNGLSVLLSFRDSGGRANMFTQVHTKHKEIHNSHYERFLSPRLGKRFSSKHINSSHTLCMAVTVGLSKGRVEPQTRRSKRPTRSFSKDQFLGFI